MYEGSMTQTFSFFDEFSSSWYLCDISADCESFSISLFGYWKKGGKSYVKLDKEEPSLYS